MVINLTQKFEYETDFLDNFEKVLDTMVRVMYKEDPSQYAHMFVTQRKDNMFRDGTCGKDMKPKFMHVCTVGDYSGDISEGDDKFDNYAELVQKVMDHLKNADPKKFLEECGSGFNSFFNEMDGSVDVGYRMVERPSGGWKNLDISLCHIYYGK